MRLYLPACFLAAFCAQAQNNFNNGRNLNNNAPFTGSDDKDLANKAKSKSVTACKDLVKMEFTEKERNSIRADLEDASGDNIIYKVLTRAKDASDYTRVLNNQALNAGFLVPKAGPLVAAFVLLGIFHICCCWTCCPFCACCRCCQKKRHIPWLCKLIFMLVLGGIVVGLIITASLSMRGFDSAYAGFDTTNCAVAELVSATFNGQNNPPFLGLIGTLNILQQLKDSLVANSNFISSLKGVMDDTQEITDAVTLATGTMSLLQDMLDEDVNVKPRNNANKDLGHECTICPELSTQLGKAINAIEGGVGSALSDARVEVNKQLSGASLQNLQASMETAAEPLIQLKESIKGAFGSFVREKYLDGVSDAMGAYGVLASIGLILFALLLSLCGFSGLSAWLCLETKKGEDGEKKFRAGTHRCACVTWCGSCYYTMFAFLVGGLMTVLSIPFASVCLVLEDVNQKMLMDISGALDLDLQGSKGEMMTSMVEECFRNPNPSANPEMLKLILVEENGQTTTMYNKLVSNTKEKINAEFDKIGQSQSGGGSSAVNTNPDIMKLKDMLRDAKISGMTLPRSEVRTHADYRDLAPKFEFMFKSSAQCGDFTIPAGLPKAGETNAGIIKMSNTLMSEGFQKPSSTCGKKVQCSASSATSDGRACKAANMLMDLKQDLRRTTKYKCYTFKKNGFNCDVLTGNCLQNGQLQTTTYSCNVDQFTALVSGYAQRIDKVLKRLDTATAGLEVKINTNMKGLVNQNLLVPVNDIADGLTCGFLGDAYQKVLDGMCYGGVWGFKAMATAYVVCACMTLLLSMLMYIVWRIALDNVNNNVTSTPVEPISAPAEAPAQAPAEDSPPVMDNSNS